MPVADEGGNCGEEAAQLGDFPGVARQPVTAV